MSAELILKMIETVSPDDTAKLDEIDARVWCFLNDVTFLSIGKTDWGSTRFKYACKCHNEEQEEILLSAYLVSRSRDALKAIRPEGWDFCITGAQFFSCDIWQVDEEDIFACTLQKGTEELAELHAIIQAIEYERSNETNS